LRAGAELCKEKRTRKKTKGTRSVVAFVTPFVNVCEEKRTFEKEKKWENWHSATEKLSCIVGTSVGTSGWKDSPEVAAGIKGHGANVLVGRKGVVSGFKKYGRD